MIDTKKLAKLMEKQGVNNRALANEIHVTEQMVHYIVNGRKIPSLAVYVDLCDFFEVSLDYLIKKK